MYEWWSGPVWCAGSFLASTAWSMSGPWESLLFSPSSTSDPLAREDLSEKGWSHAWSCLISFVFLYFHFYPSGFRTMYREEVIVKKTFGFSFIHYTGAVGIYHWPWGGLCTFSGWDKERIRSAILENFTVDNEWCYFYCLCPFLWDFIEAWGEKKCLS